MTYTKSQSLQFVYFIFISTKGKKRKYGIRIIVVQVSQDHAQYWHSPSTASATLEQGKK